MKYDNLCKRLVKSLDVYISVCIFVVCAFFPTQPDLLLPLWLIDWKWLGLLGRDGRRGKNILNRLAG